MKLRIVPMTVQRLSAVAELERVCFPADPWSEALYQAALDNPAVAVLLALGEDGALLGYAVLSTVLDEGNLDNIAVAPPPGGGGRPAVRPDRLRAGASGLPHAGGASIQCPRHRPVRKARLPGGGAAEKLL